MLSKKTAIKTEKNCYELEITIDGATFGAAVDAVYKKNVQNINIPGFRKGKAPRALVERMYGKGVFYEEAINDCLPAAYEEAVTASKLAVVGQPEIDVVSADENGLVVKAKVYVKPDAKIEGYLGIEVEKKVAEVTDEDIAAEIDRVRERNSRMIDVTDRAAKDGDSVNIDFEGFVDGTPFEGGKAEKYDLKLGSSQFIPGFEEQIVGHAIGEEFDVNVTFPADYVAENLAGKDATFKVKLHGIKETELPALDDEFAKDVSEFDTLAEYKDSVRATIQERNEKAAEGAFEEALINALLEKVEVEVPEVMYEEEVTAYIRDQENNMKMQGLSLDIFLKYTNQTMEAFRANMRPRAEKQVNLRLALEAIAKKEGISIVKKDVDAEYKRISDMYDMPVAKIKELIPADGIKADLKVKAAMDLVKEKAIVK